MNLASQVGLRLFAAIVIRYNLSRFVQSRNEPSQSGGIETQVGLVVSYDVPDDRRRTRLAKILKDFGARVQYSVFECLLEDEQVDALRKRVERLIDAK